MLGGAEFQRITPRETPSATETSAIPGRGPGDSHETTSDSRLAAPPSPEKAKPPRASLA